MPDSAAEEDQQNYGGQKANVFERAGSIGSPQKALKRGSPKKENSPTAGERLVEVLGSLGSTSGVESSTEQRTFRLLPCEIANESSHKSSFVSTRQLETQKQALETFAPAILPTSTKQASNVSSPFKTPLIAEMRRKVYSPVKKSVTPVAQRPSSQAMQSYLSKPSTPAATSHLDESFTGKSVEGKRRRSRLQRTGSRASTAKSGRNVQASGNEEP